MRGKNKGSDYQFCGNTGITRASNRSLLAFNKEVFTELPWVLLFVKKTDQKKIESRNPRITTQIIVLGNSLNPWYNWSEEVENINYLLKT